MPCRFDLTPLRQLWRCSVSPSVELRRGRLSSFGTGQIGPSGGAAPGPPSAPPTEVGFGCLIGRYAPVATVDSPSTAGSSRLQQPVPAAASRPLRHGEDGHRITAAVACHPAAMTAPTSSPDHHRTPARGRPARPAHRAAIRAEARPEPHPPRSASKTARAPERRVATRRVRCPAGPHRELALQWAAEADGAAGATCIPPGSPAVPGARRRTLPPRICGASARPS